MSDTATIKIYRLNDNYDLNDIIKELTSEKFNYKELKFRKEIQKLHNLTITAFYRKNDSLPDWVKFIQHYLIDESLIDYFKRYSFIAFLCFNTNKENCFVITGGAESHHILTYLDHQFGIKILERM